MPTIDSLHPPQTDSLCKQQYFSAAIVQISKKSSLYVHSIYLETSNQKTIHPPLHRGSREQRSALSRAIAPKAHVYGESKGIYHSVSMFSFFECWIFFTSREARLVSAMPTRNRVYSNSTVADFATIDSMRTLKSFFGCLAREAQCNYR